MVGWEVWAILLILSPILCVILHNKVWKRTDLESDFEIESRSQLLGESVRPLSAFAFLAVKVEE